MPNQSEDQPRGDGTTRKSHYGAGRQPWDDIVDAGWGPAFAAVNVLKYLRRTKDPEHSLESARWYYARLKEWFDQGKYGAEGGVCIYKLFELLSPDERKRLGIV